MLTIRHLACGMPVILEPMSGVRSVGVAWYIPAGPATEPDELQGLSTMWSELLLRGCGLLDSRAHADALDRLGLARSVDVGMNYLRLGFTLVADRLLEALPLMVDMVRRPRMDEESIEPVRDLSIQAIESLADDPHERAGLLLRERHNFPPMNRSGLGTLSGLQAITRSNLIEGWAERALPGRAIFAVAGALDVVGGPDAVAGALDAALQGWAGSNPEPIVEPSQTRGTYFHAPDPSAQVQVLLAHDAPHEASPDAYAERIVSSVLSGGMSSRLFSEVREKRALCYAVSQSYASERERGQCVAYVGTAPERAQESLDVLLAELHRINTPSGAITTEEFDVAITGMKSRLVFAGESTSARAHALATDMHRIGRPRTLSEMAAAYDALTLEQVNAYLARRTMSPITIVTLGPRELSPPAGTPRAGA